MAGRVALPTRSGLAHDDPAVIGPTTVGGTVALPSRRVLVWRLPDGSTTVVPQWARGPGVTTELVPSTIPEAPSPEPPIGGQHGVVESPTRRFIFSRDNPWHVSAMNWAGDQIAWIRRFFPNTAGMAGFIPPRFATPDWTTNIASGECGVPANGIPYSNKRQVWTLARSYDDTIWATYRPPIKVQSPANMRAYLATQGYTQLPPYFPRLTQYATPRSYGQQTQVIPTAQGSLSNMPRPVSTPIYPTAPGYPAPVSTGMFGGG